VKVNERNEKCIQTFDWKTGREEATRRPRLRWEGNIRMELRKQVGRLCLDIFGTGWRPLVDSCEHGTKYFGSIKGGEFLD